MNDENPYESPRFLDCELQRVGRVFPRHQIMRVLALAVVGYVAYLGGTLVFALMDPAIRLSDVRWGWGILVSVALSSSEIFFMSVWSLNKRATRRMVISSVITLLSFVVTQAVAVVAGFEESRYQDPLVLPRLVIGVPIFLLLTFTVRYLLAKYQPGRAGGENRAATDTEEADKGDNVQGQRRQLRQQHRDHHAPEEKR